VCAGSPCCTAGLCTGTHINGLGQTYVDCVALGVPGNGATYTEAMAQAALTAWPNPGGSAQNLTGGNCTESDGVTKDTCDASYTPVACAVWCYTGQLAGYVFENDALDTGLNYGNCLCPATSNSPTWN
jgi:hypothetical protein